ncbi:MAG: hypothetical protein LBE35_05400 [Clostridiales bacterium]|jgi:hypothetical protein|nr:hypothetical protein [Clostridiales bacterium]
MKKTVEARINWALVEDGGRKTILPIGMRYCPILVFDGEQSDESLWTATVYNTKIDDRQSIAEVSYLADDAPYQLLESGRRFFLYEGQRIVANGVIF